MAGILIRQGRVVDPLQGFDRVTDLRISDGMIQCVGESPGTDGADLEIDASNTIVCPGFIDLSARFREPGFEHKATVLSESFAAVASGITTVCCPPDTNPIIDTPAVARLVSEGSFGGPKIKVIPIGALTRGLNGTDLSEMRSLKEAGCSAVSNAHYPISNTLVLRRALEYAASHDLLVIVRPEDRDLADSGCVHEGSVSTRMGLRGIPYAAETVAVAQVLALIEHTGARVHFSQISCARTIRSIARAQEKGLPVTSDVAVHQLHLTEWDLDGFDANYHVRPPFRGLDDREALREAIKDGVIAAVCSDHQPHEPDAKLDAFPVTEPGLSSLQTLLPLMLRLVDEQAITLPEAIAALTSGPAAVLGLDHGGLRVGERADVCIFDPLSEWKVDESTWLSAGRNTPFWHHVLKGKVLHTFVAGSPVFGSLVR